MFRAVVGATSGQAFHHVRMKSRNLLLDDVSRDLAYGLLPNRARSQRRRAATKRSIHKIDMLHCVHADQAWLQIGLDKDNGLIKSGCSHDAQSSI